jgi:hypothetical protein
VCPVSRSFGAVSPGFALGIMVIRLGIWLRNSRVFENVQNFLVCFFVSHIQGGYKAPFPERDDHGESSDSSAMSSDGLMHSAGNSRISGLAITNFASGFHWA